MVESTREIKVTSRSRGEVIYVVPDLGNRRRSFQPKETKIVTFEELQKLAWVPGGMEIIKNSLIIRDQEALDELIGEVEPEYYYTDAEIKTLLTTGTLPQLQDCLEYAPDGVIDLVKKYAVELPCNNVMMRDEIKKVTGFDVNKAIEINLASVIDDNPSDSAATGKRRTAPIAATNQNSTTSGRRAETISTGSKYKIIN